MTHAACLLRLALSLLLPALPMMARAAGDDAAPETRAAALVEPYREAGLMSGVVLVARDGQPLFRQAYGLADREWGIANTPDTHFRIGSLTKQFTAAAILLLAEAGKLTLDDPVARFLPDLPPAWAQVRLRHLLGHTSGIVNYTAMPDYLATTARLEPPPRAILASVAKEALLFAPGTRVEYSNTNYLLLGLVIEAASGAPYPRYLAEHVLAPAGLTQTGYDDLSAVLPRRARGYRFWHGQWRNAPPLPVGAAYAAGGLYSTVDDLLAWDEALFGGRVISQTSLAAMGEDGGRGYGFGWYIGTAHGQRLWSHAGMVSGFLAQTDYYPEARLAVIVLANNENAPAQTLARALAAPFLGLADAPEPLALEDLILDRYAGTYRLGPRFFLTLTRGARGLLVQATGQPALPFLPESDRTFACTALGARITMDTEPDGRPNGLVWHQNGQDQIAIRVEPQEAEAALAPPREVPVDPARLAAHLGRYDLAGQRLTVTQEGGRLQIQLAGQPRFPLYPEGAEAFFLKEVDARIRFEVDAVGRTTGLSLTQNGRATPARRLEESAPPEPGRGH